MSSVPVESTLFQQGFDMMLYGMGTVFAFLMALVMAISLLSRIVNKFFPETLVASDSGVRIVNTVSPTTRKIIQAAIDQHRKR